MTVRSSLHSMLFAASAGLAVLAPIASAIAAPGEWEHRGPGGSGGGGAGDRGADRGENRWGGQRPQQQQQQPSAPPPMPQPRAPQPQIQQPAPTAPQSRGPGAWQDGGRGGNGSGGWQPQDRPGGMAPPVPTPGWREGGPAHSAEPDPATIRTRPYGAGGQNDWRGRGPGGDPNFPSQGRPPEGRPQEGRPPQGRPDQPGWQVGQRENVGTWSRNGDAGHWQRDDDRDRGRDNRGPAWSGDRGRNEQWRNDQGRNGQWRNDQWRNEQWRGNPGGYDPNRSNRNGWDRDGDHRRWDNGWRRDSRYDWSGWRNVHRGVFHPGYYYAPYRGYSYSRLSIGIFLGAPFYAEQYWITDPWAYRLPPAYGPYRWVRYYDDVLLVDIYSGEVVDVIHDFFW